MSIMILVIVAAVAGSLSSAFPQRVKPETEIGIDEHLGEFVPQNITLTDENDEEVELAVLLTSPVILNLVYYRCPGICSPLMSGIAEVVSKLDLEPGVDYSILTVSFDPTESPSLAADKKKNYLNAVAEGFPPEAWRFMTADSADIARLTEAVGFRYRKEGKEFLHTAALIVLSPEGKIARYVYGVTFLPFEVKMALLEASEGRVGPTVSRVLLYCFSYDPEGRTYVFNILKVSATVILFFAAAFIAFLTLGGRKKSSGTKGKP